MPQRPHSTPPSPALLVAQKRLLALREESRAQRAALGLPLAHDEHGRLPANHSSAPEPTPSFPSISNSILPPHLGWESAPLTAVLRRQLFLPSENKETPAASGPLPAVNTSAAETGKDGQQPPTAVSLRVYPDVALGILRREQAAAARLWYLLRHLDEEGCGWIKETEARRHFTRRNSALRLCGERHLRNLLNQGEGLFWQRQEGRIWLRSLAKVAAALGVTRLQGRPVAVPLSQFTAGIGTFRAHLYATFHSGRGSQEKAAGPIARETVATLSHVPPRTQRLYEAKAGVEKAANFALGQPVNPQSAQEIGWQKGRALFHFTDHRGKHGRAGVTYLAWQLPNSYHGPHRQQKNGRQKRLNQTIADLLPIGMTGNGNGQAEPLSLTERDQRQRRYCHHGEMAARLYNRSARDFYWPAPGKGTSRGVWYVLRDKVMG
ncbi:MAG: hypothetical protein R6X32_03245 [Chloroflexota bacterium]